MEIRKFVIMISAAISVLAASGASAAALPDVSTIKGLVLGKDNGSPVGFATVAVMRADSSVVTGVACDAEGAYRLEDVPYGNFRILFSMMGYRTVIVSADVASPSMELAPVYLEPDAESLKGAAVTGKLNMLEMKVDKLVMNVSQSAYASGSDALELLKKAPGVTIDKDGNVKLNGKPVSVWLDGRPSHMDGKALESLLRSTNGESIDKLELMEHPSSKYDAEGQGGIINIKTKKNALQGFNGSLGLGGGGMFFDESGTGRWLWRQKIWANLAYRTEKSNTWVNLYEGTDDTDVIMDNTLRFETPDGVELAQDAHSLLANRYLGYGAKIGEDWFIDEHNTLGAILYVPGDRSRINSVYSTTEQRLDGELSQMMSSRLENSSSSFQYTANLNYTHVFDEAASAELTANLDYYHNDASADNRQNDDCSILLPAESSYPAKKEIVTSNLYDIYSAKADWQSVVAGKYMLEAGAKWALSKIESGTDESMENLFYEGVFRPEYGESRSFTYDEHVGAVYATMAGQISPAISAKAGLRGEYTRSLGSWSGAVPRKYFDLFPTVYLGYVPSERWMLSATYTRRIGRPRYDQLDPTKTYLDATTWIVGDPDILPQYGSEFSVGGGYGQHLSLYVGYNYGKNIVLQLPTYYEDGTKCLTWGNFGVQRLGYVSFSISALPLAPWLDWTFNTNAIYIDSFSREYDGFSNNGWNCQVYTDFAFILPGQWKAELDGYLSTPTRVALYKVETQYSTDLALKKTLDEGRVILGLSVDDLFRTSANNLEILDPAGKIYYWIGQRYNTQKVLLNFTWNFGKAQQSKARKVGNLEEISRVGGGGSAGIGTK